ncbi:MAG: alpha/beta hydrolase [Planctomycetota bacterium]
MRHRTLSALLALAFLLASPFSATRAQTPSADSAKAFEIIEGQVRSEDSSLDSIAESASSGVALSKAQSQRLRDALEQRLRQETREAFRAPWEQRQLVHEQWKMPFYFKTFGEKPAEGWSLYLSMHGGGGTLPRVNDQQWENQKRLYTPDEGIYCAPRAPTNTWNLWHQPHIDVLFDQLIQCMVAFEDVNWDRVYLMGYSAGGDGVYQLAPRMADRWAAASMMAGHPNGASPLNLRNVPFTLQVGGRDSAYKRNQVAEQWRTQLAELRNEDPRGYDHFVRIYPNMGHWMQRRDAVAVGWMAERTRQPVPKKLVWRIDQQSHPTFYWLAVTEKPTKTTIVRAEVEGQSIEITTDEITADEIDEVTLLLDDRLLDLDQEITVRWGADVCFSGKVTRNAANLIRSLTQRGDPRLAFPARVTVARPQ